MDVNRGKGRIGHAIYAENRTTWPKTVGRKKEEREGW